MYHNLQLTIGNNINNKKMSFLRWRKFQKEVTDLALSFPHEWNESHRGVNSQWNGKKELSFKISVFSDEPFEITESFKIELHEISKKYSQDAIALTVGTSKLSSDLVKGGE